MYRARTPPHDVVGAVSPPGKSFRTVNWKNKKKKKID
jgi:hypothetical protein